MISLAPYRYRNVLATEGGPIEKILHEDCSIGGSPASQATAYLKEDIYPGYTPKDAEGAGTHESPMVARFMAISEALERWALRETVNQGKLNEYGLDVDITSNGMAAFPGIFESQARKKAYAEAIERHCLISWWEGILPCSPLSVTNLKERGVEIANPYSSHSVVILWKLCHERYYCFSFGYGKNAEHATWRARIEMERTEAILADFYEKVPFPTMSTINELDDVILKRVVYFSTRHGFREFLDRLKAPAPECPPKQKPKTIFDGKIPGPWNQYATVWRVVFDPPTRKHLEETHNYFFW